METPIQTTESAINELIWKERFRASVVCFFILLFGIAAGIIISDSRIMNRVEVETVREVTVIEQKGQPMNIFDTKGKWISQGDPIKLEPIKKEK